MPGPDDARERLPRDYRPAFQRYLVRRDETSRNDAYLLGRAALGHELSVLDLVAAHHVVLLEVLPDARDTPEVLRVCTAAAEFLAEVLASYSMAALGIAHLQQQLQAARDELAALRRTC